ncbi:MAG: histidine kinase [Actinobacteria bacterium]|uniref:histidine kinase n=1 Tax=freshwater metagenome TaxID=449393 RepID=A0A6J6P806_9ZZZZ|nr:histidine kinase [Actinomycetota bacterium]
MLSVDELISSQSALTNEDRARLMELLAEWQLLSDLSFADLILWIPKRKNYQSWPDGHIAMAHIRPTTAATVFAHDVIGNVINWGSNPRIDGALSTGEIDRDSDAEMVGEILIKEETVPVFFDGRVIAVISRHRNADLMRSPSRLELNYREIAHKIYQMVAEGTFPLQNSFYRSESAPRVGDGLIRLDANGLITYASPNARSAFNRAGWSGELEGHQLGDVIESVKPNLSIPTDESWRSIMSGKNLRREEFENESGIFDLLVMPLVAGSDHIGAIVLLHNVTELRRRDRALITKDVTIREIHHRVKNNLQTVSALLRLQSRRVEDVNAKLALEEAVRRVASIAIVHETLSNSSTESVAFDEVYDRIVHNAIELSTHKINVEKLGSFGTFDSQIATPLALVITELIHNALEHGLANSGEKLRIEISRTASQCVVKIIDDGVGLPTDFNWDQSSNLGLQIVKTLTENELKGSIELVRVGSETQAVLKF